MKAIQKAWDSLDSGLKQWIVTGISMAVSFIPLVGPLISCIIDGTFIDMIKALSTGDWATLGMCALAFVPGVGAAGKVLKSSLKTIGGTGKIAAKGFFEAAQLKALKKLALKAEGKTFKFNDNRARHMVRENHLQQIAEYKGCTSLRQTMKSIKSDWKYAEYYEEGKKTGYKGWRSNTDRPLEYMLDFNDNTIVSVYPNP